MNLPSLPKLRTFRLKIENHIRENLCIAQHPLTGVVYEELCAYLFELITKSDDYTIQIDEIGDGSVVDQERLDEQHRNRRRRAIENLLMPVVGQVLDDYWIRQIALRVAGRREELREGSVSQDSWSGEKPAQTLLYIRDIKRVPSRGRLYEVEFEGHTGPAAGLVWVCKLTGGFLQHLMRDIGVRVYEKYQDEDISGMWFIADIHYSREGKLVMNEVATAHSQRTYNKKLAAARLTVCRGPFKPLQGKPCQPCPLDRKLCPRSRYNQAFLHRRKCVNGHFGLFQNDRDDYCFNCLRKGDFKRDRSH